MNKFWISTISAAGTLGTAGAAFAGVNAIEQLDAAPSTATTIDAAPSDSTERTISYQIGAAGIVTVTVHDGVLTVVDVVAADGWSVVGATAPGVHVEVQLSDGLQVVTFGADLVAGDVAVTLTTAPVTTDTSAVDTTVPGGFDVTIISDTPGDDAPTPYPGTPGTGVPTTSVPHSSTTAPSGGGYDEYEDDEYEDEDEHHEEDHEEDEHDD